MIKKIITITMIISMFAIVTHYEHNYTLKDCMVTEATTEGCMIVDNKGEGWYIEGKGYEVGQVVDLKLYDNNTENTNLDDIVKKVVVK